MSSTWLITGASRGLGFELVKQLSTRPNTTIFAGARNPEKSAELQTLAKSHHNVVLLKLDVSREEDVQNAIHEIEKKAGGLDVLVANAGVMGETGFLKDAATPKAAVDNLHKVFETNVFSVLRTDLAFFPLLRKRATKKIVNISSLLGSISGLVGSFAYFGTSGPYNASKTTVNMISKQLALELKDEGFTVLALHPGWVDTDMGSLFGKPPLQPEESVQGQLKVIDSASNKITGEFISYDGSTLAY